MMYRTCTVQVNLDFASEADMVKKLRVGAGAAAGGDRALRLLAVLRGPGQRLAVLAGAHLARHRPGPHRHAALRVRGRHGLRALRRLRARRADVLRLPRRALHRRAGAVLPRLPRRPAAGAAGREADAQRLGRPPDHALPRGAHQALHGDARRRRRARGGGSARCRRSGWGCSTTARARRGVGSLPRLERGGAGRAAPRRRRRTGCAPRSAAGRCASSPARCWRSPRRG